MVEFTVMTPFPKPTFSEERALLARGFSVVAGTDEAGCGCWAGPVSAAAVILPLDSRIGMIRDSKTLSAAQRESLAVRIKEVAVAWSVSFATAAEIDRLNIRAAGALAMRRAIDALAVPPEFVLIDAFRIPGLALPSKSIVRGDGKVKSIAAASILAKVERDALMTRLDDEHPGYGFARHKGYGTKEHQAALARLGPCSAHRLSYAPVRLAMPQAMSAKTADNLAALLSQE